MIGYNGLLSFIARAIPSFYNRCRWLPVLTLSWLLIAGPVMAESPKPVVNYAEALQKSIYFYEAQQSGRLPAWNRVPWRADSSTDDGKDAGLDLSGGWYDAGDHVKFGFPMAGAATMLAWGVVEYPQAYRNSGQWQSIRNNLKFVADYFMAAHPKPELLYAQVGIAKQDHAWWGPAEVIGQSGTSASHRPSQSVSPACPGSDVAGETAAALAAISMVFADQPDYSRQLLKHARELYDFANRYKGRYSDCIADAYEHYRSWSGYQDELVWSSLWLYRATGQRNYLQAAETLYTGLNNGSPEKAWSWTHSWDDKSYGSYLLLARLTGKPHYRKDVEHWLDFWTIGHNGQRVHYTAGGFAQLDAWGSTRYAANTAWAALLYSDYLREQNQDNDRRERYYRFAVRQMNYILGDNPKRMSYQIGMGDNSPRNPHHRGSHGSWNNNIEDPAINRHLLVGALVGGPYKEDQFDDDRTDYIGNEISVNYNAGFTSALARLYLDFGGQPIVDSQFPPAETIYNEYEVFARITSGTSGSGQIALQAKVQNRTSWPARVNGDLTLRYWLDLRTTTGKTIQPEQIRLRSSASGPKELRLSRWGNRDVYYVDIPVSRTATPGDVRENKGLVDLTIQISGSNERVLNKADSQWQQYNNRMSTAAAFALYENDALMWGQEPCENRSGLCNVVAENKPVGTTRTFAPLLARLMTRMPATASGVRRTGKPVPEPDLAPGNPDMPPEPISRPSSQAQAQEKAATPGYQQTSNHRIDTQVTATSQGVSRASQVFSGQNSAEAKLLCRYVIREQWPGGFAAEIEVSNRNPFTIHGWEVRWHYADGSRPLQTWNARLINNGSHIATPDEWNRDIPPGGSLVIRLEGVTASVDRKSQPPIFEDGCMKG